MIKVEAHNRQWLTNNGSETLFSFHRSGKPRQPHSVATFNGEHKSSKELRDYLCSIQDQCENCDLETLPTVIILDNLHHVSSLGDVFSGFLSHKSAKW